MNHRDEQLAGVATRRRPQKHMSRRQQLDCGGRDTWTDLRAQVTGVALPGRHGSLFVGELPGTGHLPPRPGIGD